MPTRVVPAAELLSLVLVRSPVLDVVASLRALQGADDGRHRRWRRWALPRVAGLDLGLLLALVPPSGHLADVLTPPPRRGRSFADELELVAVASAEAVRHDVRLLLEQGSSDTAALRTAAEDPSAALDRVVEQLRRYRRVALEPVWSRIDRVEEADLDWRVRQFAERGPVGVLSSVHDRLAVVGADAHLETTCVPAAPSRGGVVLVPCVFAWPDLLVHDVEGGPLMLAYGPRGVGSLWHTDVPSGGGIARALGPTRARLLQALALPASTTELAAELGVAASTVSEHLGALAEAGLVHGVRRGRSVRYSRTAVADGWVASLGGSPRAAGTSLPARVGADTVGP